jgi:thiamine-monophosphate kinase
MDEFDLIRILFSPLAAEGGLGLRDDAAILTPPPGKDLVLTKDAIVEGVHFRADDPPERIARKLQRVNLSDLAAKGAEPLGYMLACAFRADTGQAWLEAFAAGLALDQQEFGWELYGGDTVSTPGPLTFSLTAFGTVPVGQTIQRAGASVGEDIFVTGWIGDGGLGLGLLTGDVQTSDDAVRRALVDRYQVPDPRVSIGLGLRGLASAAVDISDGLIADAGHLGDASGVGIILELAAVPVSDSAATILRAGGAKRLALTGFGDDYEVLFTCPASRRSDVGDLARCEGVPISRIGSVCAGTGVRVMDGSDAEVEIKTTGYAHFLT